MNFCSQLLINAFILARLGNFYCFEISLFVTDSMTIVLCSVPFAICFACVFVYKC